MQITSSQLYEATSDSDEPAAGHHIKAINDAVASGKEAAHAVHRYLVHDILRYSPPAPRRVLKALRLVRVIVVAGNSRGHDVFRHLMLRKSDDIGRYTRYSRSNVSVVVSSGEQPIGACEGQISTREHSTVGRNIITRAVSAGWRVLGGGGASASSERRGRGRQRLSNWEDDSLDEHIRQAAEQAMLSLTTPPVETPRIAHRIVSIASDGDARAQNAEDDTSLWRRPLSAADHWDEQQRERQKYWLMRRSNSAVPGWWLVPYCLAVCYFYAVVATRKFASSFTMSETNTHVGLPTRHRTESGVGSTVTPQALPPWEEAVGRGSHCGGQLVRTKPDLPTAAGQSPEFEAELVRQLCHAPDEKWQSTGNARSGIVVAGGRAPLLGPFAAEEVAVIASSSAERAHHIAFFLNQALVFHAEDDSGPMLTTIGPTVNNGVSKGGSSGSSGSSWSYLQRLRALYIIERLVHGEYCNPTIVTYFRAHSGNIDRIARGDTKIVCVEAAVKVLDLLGIVYTL